MMDVDKKNLIIAIVLSLAIFMGWNYFFPAPTSYVNTEIASTMHKDAAPMEDVKTLTHEVIDRSQAIGQVQRVIIASPTIKGSIALTGARFDDITLAQYYDLPNNQGDQIHLLSPVQTPDPYMANFGWTCDDKTVKLPQADSIWTPSHQTLTPHQPVTLTWDNGDGLLFEHVIQLDDQYLFNIKQTVKNTSGKIVKLTPYGSLYRGLPKSVSDFFILHEGPIGYLNGKLIEHKYKDIQEKNKINLASVGGWLGVTDKYWLTALIPDQGQAVQTHYRYVPAHGIERYQVDYAYPVQIIEPDASASISANLFTGPKVLKLLDAYETKLGVKHFDLAVDFGWYYIITKPIFHILTFANQWLGNFGLAIMLLTVILKALFYPLANKSYRSMARMKEMQPKMERLKERFKDDRVKLNQEMMELYKREKINPLAGCLPMVIQIPVFFALYKVLFVTIEMRHAPFYGWINDLSMPDPTSLFNLFGLIPWTPPSFLMIGAWPIIMGATMLAQQKLNPPPADPAQAKLFMIMPVVFTFMLAQFPAGLVIYWAWNNILSIIQQWSITRVTLADQVKKS